MADMDKFIEKFSEWKEEFSEWKGEMSQSIKIVCADTKQIQAEQKKSSEDLHTRITTIATAHTRCEAKTEERLKSLEDGERRKSVIAYTVSAAISAAISFGKGIFGK